MTEEPKVADAIHHLGLAVEKRGPMRYALVDVPAKRDISIHVSRRSAMMTMWRVAGDMRRAECVRDGASSSPRKDR